MNAATSPMEIMCNLNDSDQQKEKVKNERSLLRLKGVEQRHPLYKLPLHNDTMTLYT